MTVPPTPQSSWRAASEPLDLSKYAWLSIAAAVATITLKVAAWWMTKSVGLLSDAAETFVNLIAAVVALIALKLAVKRPNRRHNYGLTKAEYFSAATEGAMIFVAALVIIYTAIERFIHPQPVENLGIGIGVSVLASIVNGLVAWVLLRAAAKHRSMTLHADGKHLVADIWTSCGVIVGVTLVWVTRLLHLNCWWLDPLVALIVGLNIIRTGFLLLRDSSAGLMDVSMSREENDQLVKVLREFIRDDGDEGRVTFHALRTRVSGRHRFAEVHVLVPGRWTVFEGHDLCERVEQRVHEHFDDLSLICHLEPIEDPKSYEDIPDVEIPVPEDATP